MRASVPLLLSFVLCTACDDQAPADTGTLDCEHGQILVFDGDLTGVPADLVDGDDDTLADTTCADGQILVYSTISSAWQCGEDSDTTLTQAEVITMVESQQVSLHPASVIGGITILHEGSNVAWSQLTSVPADLADGDDDSLADLGLSCTADGEPAAS